MKTVAKSFFVAFALCPLTVALSAPRNHTPTITLLYTTAETSTSATVVWNTNIASDSLLQYSTTFPVPAEATRVYRAAAVTYHEIQLDGLRPGTLYHFTVTSCAKKGCTSATGSFDTYPICPDVVPPVSGNWQRESSPNVGDPSGLDNDLLATAALSDSDVWAVGWSQQPNGPPYVKRTLIQHFDGAAWRIVPSPNRENHYLNVLHGVSGTSANDIWAVGGSHGELFPSETLIQHWDGTQWSIVSSPSPDDQLNELRAVAAIAPNNAWAVGYSSGTQSEQNIDTLILHWDGVRWSEVPSPNVPGGANQLFGIGVIAPNDIWAVGFAAGSPLAMRWNGSTWTIVPVKMNAGSSSEWFTAVSGASSNDVWAVGQSRGFFTNRASTTLKHWDGVHWTEKVCRAASASNPPADYEGGGPDAYLTGISAAAHNDVWAVGVLGSGPLILHWDGQAWTTVTHPRAFPNSQVLRGVTTVPEGEAWAVGVEIVIDSGGQTTTERTLIDRYRP